MTEVLKGKTSKQNKQAQSAFEEIKKPLTSAPILTLPSLSKIFEVECDAYRVDIGAVLSQ